MIKLFNYKENNFNSNGIATIQPLTLMEYKEISLNGWRIETEIPIKYNDLIKEGMIALVETKSKGAQPFLISNITKTTKTLHFVAKHYVFDSINYVLEDVRPTNMSAAGALKYINDRTDIKSPFTTNSNVSATNTAYFINKNMLEALDTIQERWGGVYDVDKFHINLKNKVGIDRGDTIMYGKNLEGLKVFEDWSNVVTKLLPIGFDGLTLPEKFLHSEIDYGKPYTKVVRFETELEDEERTEEALIQELRANALEYLKENEVPKLSYEVESNINQRLGIGDTIHVKHPVVDILTEVIAYEYNVLTKRVTKITFGNYKRSVKKKVDSIKNSIKEVAEKTNDFETIINDQTNIINDMNKKGHVYIDENQIMVLDKIPKETAMHVWRWNMGGLGYSENGIEGPFKQAWTIDGKFNTEFIAANSIMTNQLHSSVGSSLDISSNESISMLGKEINLVATEFGRNNMIRDSEVGLEISSGYITEYTRKLDVSEHLKTKEKGLFNLSARFYAKKIVSSNGYHLYAQFRYRYKGESFNRVAEVGRDVPFLNGETSLSETQLDETFELDPQRIESAYLEVGGRGYGEEVKVFDIVLKEGDEVPESWSLAPEDKLVTSNGIITSLNLDNSGVKIRGPKISLEGIITANGNIKIFEDGSIEINEGIFRGKIKTDEAVEVGTRLSMPVERPKNALEEVQNFKKGRGGISWGTKFGEDGNAITVPETYIFVSDRSYLGTGVAMSLKSDIIGLHANSLYLEGNKILMRIGGTSAELRFADDGTVRWK